ncbi:uncharacterized protein LAJ45_07527 [Morchella importuna]|uniref:uncharacterized protein n=1 Tax=Morchella importuna TaxID=1174673 RepID=UPI001E8DA632|nr:uncharacterized protein LAJ45_07527 [Morchella importuna]KAH8148425.1 hypothetical protein LAJ45_07527 [Morchella importuna]
MTDTTQLAPYGYTATGRVRKRPLKNSQKENSVPEPNRYEKFKYTYRKFLNCPACYKDFSHRPDSHRAVWQHLLHFATVAKEPKHQKARDALKEIRDRTPTEEVKKNREKISSAEWRARNPKKAKRASVKGATKLKIERNLRRAGEFSEEKLNKLLEEKMVEWDAEN